MLTGDGTENAIKINRSNWQKNKFSRAAHFFSYLATQQICTCIALFLSFFAVVLLDYNAVLYG